LRHLLARQSNDTSALERHQAARAACSSLSPAACAKLNDMNKYKKIPSVGSVMTPFPYFVDIDTSFAEVERLMVAHDIRHIPVQQDGRVVGIVSERDVWQLLLRFLPEMDATLIRARDIMTDEPYVAGFDTPLNEVALEMAKRRIGSAIIVHHEKLAGILSVTDICRILAEVLESEFPTPGDDVA
jgi:acetoin utilization protein AcuB